jgi:hypothetical protein
MGERHVEPPDYCLYDYQCPSANGLVNGKIEPSRECKMQEL